MTAPVVVPADPAEWCLTYLRGRLIPAEFPDWTAGNQIPAGQTPVRFVRVETVGSETENAVVERPQIRLQFWGTTGSDNHARTLVARITAGYLRAELRCQRVSGIVSLPDPTNQARSITQFTVTALLAGDQT